MLTREDTDRMYDEYKARKMKNGSQDIDDFEREFETPEERRRRLFGEPLRKNTSGVTMGPGYAPGMKKDITLPTAPKRLNVEDMRKQYASSFGNKAAVSPSGQNVNKAVDSHSPARRSFGPQNMSVEDIRKKTVNDYKKAFQPEKKEYGLTLEDYEKFRGATDFYGLSRSAGMPGLENSISELENNYWNYTMVNFRGLSAEDDKYLMLKYITDEDKELYNYIFNKEGKDKADDYLDKLVGGYLQQDRSRTQKEAYDYSQEHPVLGSLKSFGTNLMGTVQGIFGTLDSALKGDDINPDSGVYRYLDETGGLRSGASAGMGDVGKFVYNTIMSTGDSIIASAMGSVGGAVLMGSSAGVDGVRDALDKGADTDTALFRGLCTGIAEGLFEKLSIGNFKALQDMPVASVKDLVKNLAKTMLVNASEEAATELSNTITDYLIMGDLSDYDELYNSFINQGMGPDEAKNATLVELGRNIVLAGAGGALQGGIMGGAGAALNYGRASYEGSKIDAKDYSGYGKEAALWLDGNETQPYEIKEAVSSARDYAGKLEARQQGNRKISNFHKGTMARLEKNANAAMEYARSSSVKGHDISDAAQENKVDRTVTMEDGSQSEIVSAKDGGETVIVRNEDNSTTEIRREEIEGLDENIGKLINSTDNYGENGARGLISNFDGSLATKLYESAYSFYYQLGRAGNDMEKFIGEAPPNFTTKMMADAYQSGRLDAEAVKTPAETIKDSPGVVDNKALKKVDSIEKMYIDTIAKMSGVQVEFSDSLSINGSRMNGYNKDGRIYIALDAENPSLVVFNHELTHQFEKTAPEEFKVFRDELINYLVNTDTGGYQERFSYLQDLYRENGSEYSDEAIMNEIAANSTEMFQDERFINNVVLNNRSVAKKFLNAIKRVIGKIKAMLSKIEPGSYEAKQLAKDRNTFYRIQELWSIAYKKNAERAMNATMQPPHTAAATLQGNDSRYSGGDSVETDISFASDNANADIGIDSIQKSISETFESEIDSWDGKQRKVFYVGETSDILAGLGVSREKITWDATKIEKIMSKHPSMNIDIIKQVPKILDSPFLVLENVKKYPTRITVFGDVRDANGAPVLVALELNPTSTKGLSMDNIKIASAYGKNNIQNYINNNDVLYVNPNKKITNTWLHENRLQLPLHVTKYGYIKNISFNKENVNSKNKYDNEEKNINNQSDADIIKSLMESGHDASYDMYINAAETAEEKQAAKLYRQDYDSYQKWHKRLKSVNKLLVTAEAAGNETAVADLRREAEALRTDMGNANERMIKAEHSPEMRAVFRKASLKYSKGAARQSEAYRAAVLKYGTIKQGEIPQRFAQVPKATADDGKKVRRFARTVIESGITDEMVEGIQEEILKETMSYVPVSDAKATKYATATLKEDGIVKARNRWEAVVNGKTPATKNDIALGEQLLLQAADAGNAKDVLKYTSELAGEATRAGQVVQAMRLLKRMAAIKDVGYVGDIYCVQKMVDKLNDEGRGRYNLKIDEQIAQELIDAKSEPEVQEARQKLYKNLADQMPSTALDKWNAWRYLAMLGNPRTHVRNIFGNAVFVPVVKAKNAIGTVLEKAFIKDGERSKSIKVDRVYKDYAKNDFTEMADVLSGNGKLNPSDIIRDNKKVFNNKVLESMRKGNSWLLEKEDLYFLRNHYINALSQYLQANKVDLADNSKENQKLIEHARDYAVNEAQKATYRDASAFAQLLQSSAKKNKVADVFINGVLPFKKTPINILKRSVEYSPAGLLYAISKGSYDLRKGKITATQFVDRLASGLTGSAIVALGALLQSLGVITGTIDDDEEPLKKLQGEQEYSIKLFGHSFTIDWMAPVCVPLFMGAELSKSLQDDYEGFQFKDFVNAFAQIADPMTEMSMLKGLSDAIDAGQYGSKNKSASMLSIVTNMLTGYLGQGVPTVAGQVARVIDGTRREYYTDKNSGLTGDLQYFMISLMNKTPGMSYLNSAYVDEWGEEDYTPSPFMRAFENMLSPAYIARLESSDVENELGRLYSETGDAAVIPKRANKYFQVNGVRKNLTASEYEKFQTAVGKVRYDLVSELTDRKEYDRLTVNQQVEAVRLIYDYAYQIAKYEQFGVEPDAVWKFKAYKANKPVTAIINKVN